MIILKQVIHYTDTNSVEATWTQDDVVIKCHSYADVQMQMLRDDAKELGTPLDEYKVLITFVIANIKPAPEVKINRIPVIQAELVALDFKKIRPLSEGDTKYLAELNAQAIALRKELKGLI